MRLLYLIVCVSLLFTCGIPSFSILDPPQVYNISSGASQQTLLAFRMTSADAIGYTIYYKIYDQGSQQDILISDKQELEDQFIGTEDDVQIYVDDELVGSQLGFRQAHLTSESISNSGVFTVAHDPDKFVYIYFNGSSSTNETQDAFIFVRDDAPNDIDTNNLSDEFKVVGLTEDSYATEVKLGRDEFYRDAGYGDLNFYKSFYEKYDLGFDTGDLNSTIRSSSTGSPQLEISFAVFANASPNLTNFSSSQAIFLGSVKDIPAENKEASADSKP